MKPLLNVDKDQKKHRGNSVLNTVHRSSLLVPKILDNQTYISFLNHFLLKRDYQDVVMRLTGYKQNGESGDSKSYTINEPIVYTFCLDDLEDIENMYTCYQVEFFCAKNLFIPFPAVIVNHISSKSLNTVHSYNRILNDTREDENINKIHVKEASIDFINSNKLNTFFIFQTGLFDVEDQSLKISLEEKGSGNNNFSKNIPLKVNKMSSKKFNLNEIFSSEFLGKDINPSDYTLKILQPKQKMFYGRLLTGIEDIETGSFSGNHSYYDSSETQEYFTSSNPKNSTGIKNFSFRTFPFFLNAKNGIRVYPVMSEGKGVFTIYINYLRNNKIETKLLNNFDFDNTKSTLSISIDELLNKSEEKFHNIQTFTVLYTAKENHKVPTRVNMQLIYGSNLKTNIDASINVSLINNNAFSYDGKSSQNWIQMVNLDNYISRLGICFADHTESEGIANSSNLVELSFYDSSGFLIKKSFSLKFLELLELNSKDINSKDKFGTSSALSSLS